MSPTSPWRLPALALVPVLTLGLAACGGSGDATAAITSEATTTTEAPTTTTVVDIAAVNGTAGNEFQANIRAIYGPDQVMRTITDLDEVGPAAIANPPGRPTTTVVELRTASPSCIFFVAERDLSPLAAEDYEQDLPTYVQLVPAAPAPGNPTPWLIEFDFTYDDGTDPGDPCA